MENNAEKFDKLFRDKLENLDVPYEQAHWEEMEQMVDQLPKGSNLSWGAGKIALISGALVATLAGIYYFSDTDEISVKSDEYQTTSMNQDNTTSTDAEITDEGDSAYEKTNVASNEEITDDSAGKTSAELSTKEKSPAPVKSIEEEIDHISSHNTTANKTKTEAYIESNTDNVPDDPSIANFDNAKLKTNFTANQTRICVGNEVKFELEKSISGASYYWNFGDGGITSREANPTRKFMRPGVFTVTLIVSKGEKNDYITKREEYIKVEPSPEFSIEWDDSELTSYDPYTEFTAVSNASNANFSWKIANKTYTGKKAEHIFEEEGNYLAELTVNNGQCSVTKVEELQILKTAELPVEQAFTVNSDGLNDVFPAILSSIEVPFKLMILDFSGKQLYYTESNSSPWNGKVNNSGEVVPEGTYKCIIITRDKYNKEHHQVNMVKVLR